MTEYAVSFIVDTNVEIVAGLGEAAALARRLGDGRAAERYEDLMREFSDAINRRLLDEEKGAYYPYLLKSKTHENFLMASAPGTIAPASEICPKACPHFFFI